MLSHDGARAPARDSRPVHGRTRPATDPASLAALLAKLRTLNVQVRDAQREISEAFRELSAQYATGTFHLDDGSIATVAKGEETVYDIEALETELRFAGMPEEVLNEIIETTVTRKVKAVRAKQAAARNPVYAEILERNSRTVEKTPYVSLSERKPSRSSAKRTEGEDP